MRLAIFDLDGTLTDTNEVDTECFLRAWSSALDVDCAGVQWSWFEHVTDAGITETLLERFIDEDRRASARTRVRARFLELMAAVAAQRPTAFAPVAGAVGLVPYLAESGWSAAIATGASRASAELKLKLAGLGPIVPMSTSDCCISRVAVVRHAIEMAKSHYASEPERIVVLGDAPWDVHAAAALRLPFIGVGREASRLGATHALSDYSDRTAVLRALEEAGVPED